MAYHATGEFLVVIEMNVVTGLDLAKLIAHRFNLSGAYCGPQPASPSLSEHVGRVRDGFD